ncbi:MAG: Txe/YoeB family addiction module toxin [Elusimicrobiota bacterium]|jgi:Txe/YoeB family toxin of toxin-antitoxin system|nr:Txe/YoeB family addiction module toxin [Elusimicrobiota bacterium]
MTKYKILISSKAQKDKQKIKQYKVLKDKVDILLNIITQNPYQIPPDYEKLSGKLVDTFSRRINKQHRLVYEVFKNKKIVRILSMWSHYE